MLGGLFESAWSQTGDAPVYNLIATLKPIAEGVTIDGDASDWTGLPSITDAAGDAGGGDTRDIVAVSVAPLADRWLVRIETVGLPSTEDLAFWLYVDYRGQQVLDLELGLYDGFPDVLWTYPEGGTPAFGNWDDTATVFSRVNKLVEISIPLASLAGFLKNTMNEPQMAADLADASARSAIRITPFTRAAAAQGGGIVDYGPAVASYRLRETPYALDPPLPPVGGGAGTAVFAALPLPGIQYIGQGAGGIHSHASRWAYDFYRTDNALFPSDPPESTSNEDYFSFGDDVRAPAAGTVFSQDDGNPDLPPHQWTCADPPNFVFLDLGLNDGLLLTHLKNASITTTPSQAVIQDAVLGKVGHSGSCTWAHLHLDARTIGPVEPFPTRPIRLLDLEVGLNPDAADPWRRQLGSWIPREGFFVRPSAAPSPTCVSTSITLDSDDTGTSGSYLSDGEIIAGGGFAVETSDYVHFRAHTKIVLAAGFAVQSNATFLAFIDPQVDCPVTITGPAAAP